MIQKKTALITASTKGIGKAIGCALLEKGYYVFFNYSHSDKDALILESELAEYKNDFQIVKSDLSTYQGMEELVSTVICKASRLDVLVHNVAYICKTPFENLNMEEWNKSLDTNLNIPFFLTQRLTNYMKDNGRILFIGAVMGLVPHAISIPYSVSKAGLTMLAKTLVKVFKNRGITVNVVAPGFIETPYQKTKAPDHRKRIENKIALGRFGLPEEIAATCIHIIENAYINGAVIQIDGGYDME